MRISQHNNNQLPRIYNARRDISLAAQRIEKFKNGQTIVLKRNHPFQRRFLHTNSNNTDVYNMANKVEPIRKHPVGTVIDIYA
jgi:hypothetical protein